MQSSPALSWLPTIISLLVAGAALYISWLNRRDSQRRDLTTDTRVDTTERTELTLLGWTLADRLALERRLVVIETELASQRELHQVLERLMAKVLHSPHRPELDRLLELVYDGHQLSDAQVMFLVDWLDEIANDPMVSKGEQTAASILLGLISSRYKNLTNQGLH